MEFQFRPILLEKQSWRLKLKLHAAKAVGVHLFSQSLPLAVLTPQRIPSALRSIFFSSTANADSDAHTNADTSSNTHSDAAVNKQPVVESCGQYEQ